MTSRDSLGYPAEIGDADSTPSDGRVSVKTIMTSVVRRACLSCKCPNPETQTLKLKDPAGNTWEVTFPALVAGWVLALAQFPTYLIWNCVKASLTRFLAKRGAPISAGDAEGTPATDLVELEAVKSPGPPGRAGTAALLRVTAAASCPPYSETEAKDKEEEENQNLQISGWKMSFSELHTFLISFETVNLSFLTYIKTVFQFLYMLRN